MFPKVSTPLFPRYLSIWRRFIYAIKLRLLKAFVTSLLTITNPPGFKRQITKVYPCQTSLRNRVFIPKTYKSGDALMPLYLDIHGGGFAIASPVADDRFCSEFANDNKILVISLDYPKAPSHPFPSAVHALTDLVNAILEDDSLPFNKKKVAIGGFSAGANLSLAVSQSESLQGKIGGVVSYYGPLDFSIETEVKMASRPANAGPDLLVDAAPMFNWGYINQGQDLRDPLLSVAYAPKAKLPPKLYFIGCELDQLCRESEVMAERLAYEGTGEDIKSGDVWEKKGVKWEKIKNEEHGFEVMPAFGQKKVRVEKRRKEMFESTAEWLFREVYN